MQPLGGRWLYSDGRTGFTFVDRLNWIAGVWEQRLFLTSIEVEDVAYIRVSQPSDQLGMFSSRVAYSVAESVQ